MTGSGWIKLHRDIQSHWLYTEKREFSKYEAWLDLLLMASHKENKVQRGGTIIALNIGEVVTSERFLSERWSWSTKKVRNYLLQLETENMVTKISDRYKTTIFIVNYAHYQAAHNGGHVKGSTPTPVNTGVSAEAGSTEEAPKKHAGSTNGNFTASKGSTPTPVNTGVSAEAGSTEEAPKKHPHASAGSEKEANTRSKEHNNKETEDKILLHGAETAPCRSADATTPSTKRAVREFDKEGIPYKCSKYLADKCLALNPKAKVPKDDAGLYKWCVHIDYLLRLDEKDPDELREVLAYAVKDIFWQGVILSTKNFRENYDKIFARMKTRGGARTHGNIGSDSNELRQSADNIYRNITSANF